MSTSRTLAIIKPNAVESRNVGNIIAHIESEDFEIIALKKLQLTDQAARSFYEVHHARPFYGSLVSFMTSGPVYAMVLESNDAVSRWRQVMGATNPADAADGTIRKLFGESIERNSTHGSDSDENARREIGFFFSETELF